MAWTDITDAETGDILTAEQLNALRDNPIAIAEGLPNAPKLDIKALSSIEINKNNILPHTSLRRIIVDIRDNFTQDQLPVFAWIERLEQAPDNDIRSRFPTGRIIPVDYFNAPFVTGGAQYDIGSHLDLQAYNTAPFLPSRQLVNIGVFVWYQKRDI